MGDVVPMHNDAAPPAPGCAWQAAVAAALADGAEVGVLIYESAEGGIGRAPILCGRAAVRGLIEEARDAMLKEVTE